MRIDIQIPAHLRQEVAANFFLPILKGGEFFTEVQAAMAALTTSGQKLASHLSAPRQLCSRRSNSAPFTILFSDRSVRASTGRMNCCAPCDGCNGSPTPPLYSSQTMDFIMR